MALGQPPWGLWPVALCGLALALWLIAGAPSVRAGFLRGWLAGAAGFGLAMIWIIEPFLVEPERHGWMAPFALILLPGGLALFWGLAGAFACVSARGMQARLWLAGAALLGAEMLRGWLFTGLPWAQIGHIWIDTPIMQLAALGGAYLLSALALGCGAALAGAVVLVTRHGRALPALAGAGAAAVVLGLGWGWGVARLGAPAPDDRDLRVRLVQPNATQPLKWDPEFAELFFYRHLDLSAAQAEDGRAPDLVIWSETAVPFFLERPGNALAAAADAAYPAPLILGIQRSEIGADGVRRYFNSLAVLDQSGEPVAVYDKHHLVPFGEYAPVLGRFSDRLGWGGLAAQVLAGYSAGPGPELLDLGVAGRALPLICYEAIFPRNLRGTDRPDWLLQITNDAWFGAHVGPFQHLAQARLRAVEQGLPMARAANTGVSAMIDAHGRVVASLGMNRAGVVDADLPGALPPTPYARMGDLPWYVALTLFLGLAGLRRWRMRD
ncbi:MAG: apolipoprotein N-acyltransferase [Pararhodobacter sp.]|nr:apolipoprotein N-acyltransferase [Pararhodobacter sp.]